jgi:hypothetical protein
MIKCDRCNKEINPSDAEYLSNTTVRYDLCKSCYKEVIKFITEGRYYGLD